MSEKLLKRVGLIKEWAKEKGLLEHGTIEAQHIKTVEEVNETIQAILNYRRTNDEKHLTEIKDGIGDIFVTLVVGSELGIDLGVDKMKFAMFILNDNDKAFNEFINRRVSEHQLLFDLMNICIELDDETKAITPNIYDSYKISYSIACLYRVCVKYNLDLLGCIDYAYNQIKGRTGKMVNGTFVKDEIGGGF